MTIAQRAGLTLVRAYQLLIAPFAGGACRFDPSCSAYAVEAIERHGVARGVGLSLRRVARCHPWGGCGFDPVPDRNMQPPCCDAGSSPLTGTPR